MYLFVVNLNNVASIVEDFLTILVVLIHGESQSCVDVGWVLANHIAENADVDEEPRV